MHNRHNTGRHRTARLVRSLEKWALACLNMVVGHPVACINAYGGPDETEPAPLQLTRHSLRFRADRGNFRSRRRAGPKTTRTTFQIGLRTTPDRRCARWRSSPQSWRGCARFKSSASSRRTSYRWQKRSCRVERRVAPEILPLAQDCNHDRPLGLQAHSLEQATGRTADAIRCRDSRGSYRALDEPSAQGRRAIATHAGSERRYDGLAARKGLCASELGLGVCTDRRGSPD